MEMIKSRAKEWGLALAVALVGLAVWLALNLAGVHIDVAEAQRASVWPDSGSGVLLLLPAYVAGLVPILVPCVLQMSIVFTAVMTGVSASHAGEPGASKHGMAGLRHTGLFLLGYTTFYASLGAILGGFGHVLAQQGDTFLAVMRIAGGTFLAALGLHLIGLLRLPFGSVCRGPVGFLLGLDPKGWLGSPRAGVAFAIYCVGCCGPYILAVLTMAATSGSALFSASFLLVFALSMSIPFFTIALFHQLAVRYLGASARRLGTVSRVSGAILVVFGAMTAIVGGSGHLR